MRARGGSPQELLHFSPVDVAELWARFRAGETVRCRRDGAGLALAVDGGAKTYRLVCTECGHASPWFGATQNGLVFRSSTPTVIPGETAHDE